VKQNAHFGNEEHSKKGNFAASWGKPELERKRTRKHCHKGVSISKQYTDRFFEKDFFHFFKSGMVLTALVSPAACVLLVNAGHPANGVIQLALPQYAGQLSNRGADTGH